MDNQLPDKDKKAESRQDKGTSSVATVGAYSPANTPDLSAKAWYQQALKETVRGRAVIRVFSRGVMGAAAFTIGGAIATKSMKGYAPHLPVANPVQGIARFFDVVFGKPLKGAANLVGKDGEVFVNNFRPSVTFANYGKAGRSLGHEVVMVTGDFASMSIGDFWGRKIMHTLDPHRERPKWKRKDGSIDWAEAVKTFGKNWWTAVTYSAGEDWAVAVPYVLTMRHIGTPIVDKFVPGYRFDFDQRGQGGSMLIDDNSRIVGNFTGAGVVNLWERFTTYNVGTLMFREAYHWTGGRIEHWWKTGEAPAILKPDLKHPYRSTAEGVIGGAKQFTNWVARSTIKAVMYMIPAVPFFWLTRTPQSKYQGLFIHPEKGELLYGKRRKTLYANTPDADLKFALNTPVFFSVTKEPAVNPFKYEAEWRSMYPHARSHGFWDWLLLPVGKAADKVRTAVHKPLGNTINKVFHTHDGAFYADIYTNAAMAYTPYFWAKSDWLADKVDTGKMDVALDRAIAGAVKVNPGEFKAGAREVWQALWHKPFSDPRRELYAQCRAATDKTPSDNKFDVNPHRGESCDQYIQHRVNKKDGSFAARVPGRKVQEPASVSSKQELDWRKRIVQGRPEDRPEVGADKPRNYAEQEEMRKALEQLVPPTSSIH